MNKFDAQTLATRLTNLYSTEENGVKFTLPNYFDEEKMKDCFYVGIWLGDNIVGTTDEAQFDTLLRFARILMQTEADLLQEQPDIIENIKDTPGGVREMSDSPEEKFARFIIKKFKKQGL